MIDLTMYNPSVLVNVDAGIYVLPGSSASGKTYLCTTLRELSGEERVNSYTYYDKTSGLSLSSILDNAKYDLILLDRYDMYYGDCVKEIKEFSKSGVVLVDCKAETLPFASTLCSVRFDTAGFIIS